ncbi:4-diphosphocytidyl-2C-methyl-D-erythritol kinase [Aminithiophilus ramosus]|uniref:4-diphosphocytidyl-2-C-methyl-D-erythritol kinase n=2 Tax=Synergistales TaxID=649776 RepID=A0A9Q7EXY4_9BACT|nr:4-diphosphocytidyl-2C-methyl-D-erythritol kinase [Aminithiophilus ramosus]QTX32950.1 4-diphosphocytidyl-2C-methyl-D-erythritol kinase [Aminithiophilus ramosus]QVL37285.1 4-diphosphocytidyl-2C-methyl-D-erythritol kinase [Synergistota bacterium]
MNHVLYSPAKLNLTLRIGARRADGLHDLSSVFLRLPSVEALTITMDSENNVKDLLSVQTIELKGINLVTRASERLRALGWPLPFLRVSLWKQLPPGTGFGAGSGNGAAFLRWASALLGRSLPLELARELGADVPFLVSGLPLAFACGVGERLEGLKALNLSALLLVPRWSSPTARAFADLDRRREERGSSVSDPLFFRIEAETLVDDLRRGATVGLLPNDFTDLLAERHPEYGLFFAMAEKAGALAWGISGSGSGAFALAQGPTALLKLVASVSAEPWVTHLLVLE